MSPRLIQVEDCVLIEERYDATAFQQWRAQLGDQRETIERTVNHVHLWDLVDATGEGVPDERLAALAQTMAAGWAAAVAEQFPERIGEVVVTGDEEDYGPTITLFTRIR